MEKICNRVTSNPNITNQRIDLMNLRSTLKITLQYTTLHYAMYITLQHIGVIQKYVTVLVGRCAQFGKLITKENIEVVEEGVCA